VKKSTRQAAAKQEEIEVNSGKQAVLGGYAAGTEEPRPEPAPLRWNRGRSPGVLGRGGRGVSLYAPAAMLGTQDLQYPQ